MSLLLDVVQRIVLHNAYELTCAAATQVIHKCTNLDSCKTLTTRSIEGLADDQLFAAYNKNCSMGKQRAEPKRQLVKPANRKARNRTKSRAKTKLLTLPPPPTKRDVPRKNSGPIDPPQESSMCLVRDSYFS